VLTIHSLADVGLAKPVRLSCFTCGRSSSAVRSLEIGGVLEVIAPN
jgi:hypothetical protein